MSLKKLLGIISVVIVVVFSLMLTTSYAWYSFENASTTFDVVTNNDDIIVSYQTGEYISTDIAVPIASSQIDKYSDKNNFTVSVKDNKEDNEMVVTVSLADISIDNELKDSNFKIELYHQSSKISTVTGNNLIVDSNTTKELGTVTLIDDIANNFEVRVYLLDNGGDQTAMMDKSFQAKIKVDVVSRLKTSFKDYTNSDIYVSAITIDGVTSKSLPTEGYYNMTASCTKGSNLTWEPISKTITYNSTSYVNDECSLTFTTSTNPDYPLLSDMPEGSYVKYTGNNGCKGKSCSGQNANYVDDTNMGYCSANYNFYVNGWRIGYKKNGGACLISAGALECVKTYFDRRATSTSTTSLSTSYYYGSGYEFNKDTGKFSLTGVTSSRLAWSSNYTNIIENTPYTCKKTSSSSTCSILYEISSRVSSTQGYVYVHNNTDGAGLDNYIANLDDKASKYCNKDFAYGGVCNSDSVWAMDAGDFEKITGSVLSSSSCYNKSSDMSCGYSKDLIDNGGHYWLATPYTSTSTSAFYFNGYYRKIQYTTPTSSYGLRPIIYLKSTIKVTGGSGTYEEPYTITY